MIDRSTCTHVYSDNQACVQWLSSVTSKGVKHLNLQENMVPELHQDNSLHVTYIPGVINPSDIFTNRIHDSAHFRCLPDTMMVSLDTFLQSTHCVPTQILDSRKNLPFLTILSNLHRTWNHMLLHPWLPCRLSTKSLLLSKQPIFFPVLSFRQSRD